MSNSVVQQRLRRRHQGLQQEAGELQRIELLCLVANGKRQLTVSEQVPDGRTNRRAGTSKWVSCWVRSGQPRSSEDGEPARGNRQKMLVMLAPSRCKMVIGGFGGRVAREHLQAS